MWIICLSSKMIFQFFYLLPILPQLYFKLLYQDSEVARWVKQWSLIIWFHGFATIWKQRTHHHVSCLHSFHYLQQVCLNDIFDVVLLAEKEQGLHFSCLRSNKHSYNEAFSADITRKKCVNLGSYIIVFFFFFFFISNSNSLCWGCVFMLETRRSFLCS